MADINLSNLFKTPSGTTANRPSNPNVGDQYYNGTLGYLEIYTAAGWIPATGANDFSLNITGLNTEITFSQSYAAGSYSIVSFLNDASLDIYAFAADGTSAGYTNSKAFTASQRFNKMVVLGGSVGDVLQFSYKTTYATSTSTTSTSAGPYVTSITPSAMPNQNDTITITGGNFATNVAVAFTGTGYTSTPAKSVVRSSSTSLIVTRPDNFPVSGAPYTVTVTNPSVANQPTGSAVHTYSGITAGVLPVWVTGSTLSGGYIYNSYSASVLATDADGSSNITYSYVSGSLPTGVTFNSSTATISGTPTTSGTYSYTIRATDSGGNYADRTFSITTTPSTVSGGTLASDATYYYRTFTGNGSVSIGGSVNLDVFLVAGGGGGGFRHGAGAGAGGLNSSTITSASGTYNITIGNGGNGGNSGTPGGRQGGSTTFSGGTVSLTANGGGGGQSFDGDAENNANGGCGGGATASGSGNNRSNGQGNQGGNGGYTVGNGANPYTHSGGGGIGGNGGNGDTSSGQTGSGGIGTSAYSSWGAATSTGHNVSGTYYYGGGGGGGGHDPAGSYSGYRAPGGSGGGGQSGIRGTSSSGDSGMSNTGGGGGGAATNSGGTGVGGNGGSGICIVRYTRSSVGG